MMVVNLSTYITYRNYTKTKGFPLYHCPNIWYVSLSKVMIMSSIFGFITMHYGNPLNDRGFWALLRWVMASSWFWGAYFPTNPSRLKDIILLSIMYCQLIYKHILLYQSMLYLQSYYSEKPACFEKITIQLPKDVWLLWYVHECDANTVAGFRMRQLTAHNRYNKTWIAVKFPWTRVASFSGCSMVFLRNGANHAFL